jgi:Golgi phosphoprotein 3 (GPP34)
VETLGDDLVLLALLPDGTVKSERLRYVIRGSELVRLAAARRVEVRGQHVTRQVITVLDKKPTGDALLDAALADMARREWYARTWVTWAAMTLPAKYLKRLAAGGIVRKKHRRVRGILWKSHWIVVDDGRMAQARERLDRIVRSRTTADLRPEDLVLGALVHAADLELVHYHGREASRAARRLTKVTRMVKNPTVGAVRDAIAQASSAAVQTATTTAVQATLDGVDRAMINAEFSFDISHDFDIGGMHGNL